MTTGQLLTTLSGLFSGTALEHLQSITTGVGETIFAPWYEVTSESQSAAVFIEQHVDYVAIEPQELHVGASETTTRVLGDSDELHVVEEVL